VSTLEFLDRTLADFARWADGHQEQSALYIEDNNLTPTERAGIKREIETIRELMADMVRELDLTVRRRDIRHTIHAMTLALMPQVTELEAKYLTGYGQAPEEMNRYMDKQVQALLSGLHRLAAVFENGSPEGPDNRPKP
ncbi:MAG: hypothetical protein D6800_08465, partial [Candidatus Zixiibacteriota bacterium]